MKDIKAEQIVTDFNQPDIRESYSVGVMPDNFNYYTLSAAAVGIVVLILILVFGTASFFNYHHWKKSERAAIEAVYIDIDTKRASDKDVLNQKSASNLPNGKFAVGIDTAIEIISVK